MGIWMRMLLSATEFATEAMIGRSREGRRWRGSRCENSRAGNGMPEEGAPTDDVTTFGR